MKKFLIWFDKQAYILQFIVCVNIATFVAMMLEIKAGSIGYSMLFVPNILAATGVVYTILKLNDETMSISKKRGRLIIASIILISGMSTLLAMPSIEAVIYITETL